MSNQKLLALVGGLVLSLSGCMDEGGIATPTPIDTGSQVDTDGDGIIDANDPFPNDPNNGQNQGLTLGGEANYTGSTVAPVMFPLTLSGGEAHTIEVIKGVLPEGLVLSNETNAPRITGTPAYPGFYQVTLRATNDQGTSDFETRIDVSAPGGSSSGQTRTEALDVNADSYITHFADYKHGNENALIIADQSGNGDKQALLRFAIPPTSDQLTRAHLVFTLDQPITGDLPLQVTGVSNAWNEANVNWNTLFVFGNKPYAQRLGFFGPETNHIISNAAADSTFTIDVTDLVNSADRPDPSMMSFFIKRAQAGDTSARFHSKEAPTGYPKLLLSYSLDNSTPFTVEPANTHDFVNAGITEQVNLKFSKPVTEFPADALTVTHADLLALVKKSDTDYQVYLQTEHDVNDTVSINLEPSRISAVTDQTLQTMPALNLTVRSPTRISAIVDRSPWLQQDINLDGGSVLFDVPALEAGSESFTLKVSLKDVRDDGKALIIRNVTSGTPSAESVSKVLRLTDSGTKMLIDISPLFPSGLPEGPLKLGFSFDERADPSHVTRAHGFTRGNPSDFPQLRVNDHHLLPAPGPTTIDPDWTQTRITAGQDRITVNGGAIIEYDKVPEPAVYYVVFYPDDDPTTPELEGEGLHQNGLNREGSTPYYDNEIHAWLKMGKGTYTVTPYADDKVWTLFNTADEAFYRMPNNTANHYDADIRAYFDSMETRLNLAGKTDLEKLRSFYIFFSHSNDDVYYNSAESRGNSSFVMQRILENKRAGNGDKVGIACWGYSTMLTAYARYLGYEASQGDTNGHIWTLVRIDGAWRIFDATPGFGIFNAIGR